MSRILIVDDEAGIRRSLAGILSDEGFETTAASRRRAGARVDRAATASPDLVLLDIAMPGRDGVEILVEIAQRWPGLPVVMMSGHGTIETAVRTTRHGAYDFIEKPLSIDKVLLTIQHALEQSRLERENRSLRAQTLRAHEILGESAAMTKLKEQIAVAAPSNGWVLITGENGTGKELVARQIHCQSRRARRAVRRGELRRDSRGADRVGAVRPREGRLHRRGRAASAASSSSRTAARSSSTRSAT